MSLANLELKTQLFSQIKIPGDRAIALEAFLVSWVRIVILS